LHHRTFDQVERRRFTDRLENLLPLAKAQVCQQVAADRL
jgi:hypothetical protein